MVNILSNTCLEHAIVLQLWDLRLGTSTAVRIERGRRGVLA